MKRNGLILALVAFVALTAAGVVLAGCGGSGSKSSAQSGVSPACLPATIDHSAKLAGVPVDVSPAPETDTANPATQISFLGLPAARIRVVSVVGEQSGAHAGRLESYSQGDGASFVPDKPFAAGERVLVHAEIAPASAQAAGAAGRQVSFGFRVDTPYPTANVPAYKNPPASPADYESFDTLPGVKAPILTVTKSDRDPAAGDVFTTNGPGPGAYGPLIYTPQGKLVWFDQLSGGLTAEDLNVQSYEGQRDLTFWQGKVLSLGFGQGEDVVLNSNYRHVATVKGGNGLRADLHEFQIAPGDVAYVTAYNPIRCDLSKAEGSSKGAIVDAAVQEIDIKTGLVRWEWHSLDHVAVSESETSPPKGTPWDWFHLNSIDPEPDGNILISARSTWAAYQLEGGSGRILWRLGGLKSSFEMGPGTKTAWQHDGRVLPNGEVTLYDDGSNPPVHEQSRALRIKLDLKKQTATLTKAYTHPNPPLLAASQGNMQTLVGREHGCRVRRRARAQRVRRRRIAAVRRPPLLRRDLLPGLSLPLERAPVEPAGGRGQPEQHRRRDDRAHELERRDRSRLLARARGGTSEGARAADDDRGGRLRKLDDPAEEVRLRGGPGARLRRPRARNLAGGTGRQLRLRAAEHRRLRVRRPRGRSHPRARGPRPPRGTSATLSSRVFSRPSCACSSSACSWWCSSRTSSRASTESCRSCSICRRTLPPPAWPRSWPAALAWRPVTFVSSASLLLSLANFEAHTTRHPRRRSPVGRLA